MRWVLGTVAALAALYAGYWVVGERQIESRAEAALADLRADGWTVDYADLNTTGFPSRFDTTLTDLHLADPEGGFDWVAPFVQVFALSYQPTRLIAVWPPEQVVTVDGQPVTVTSESLRASASTRFSPALPFRAATLEGAALRLAAPGWEASADRVLLALRSAGGTDYDLHLDAEGAGLADPAMRLDLVSLDARVTLDRPLDRSLAAGPEPVAPIPLALHLAGARVQVGALAVTASGDLATDPEGVVEGTVTVVAENWRGMLDLAVEAGLLDEGRRGLFEGALSALAAGGDRIEIPVTFADGRISALGLPLLDAPRLSPPAP